MNTGSQLISDEELARLAQANGLAAFEELVCRYEHRIYAFVLQSCRNPMDAQEVTQDTFVRAFQALAQWNPDRSFAAWLFTIARHQSIDHFRARRKGTIELPPDLTTADDPSQLLTRKEESRNLWQLAREMLPDPQFQALWLRYNEEMEIADIGGVLHKTKTHVKVLLFRARQALAKTWCRGMGMPAGRRAHPFADTPAPRFSGPIPSTRL